MVSVSTEERLNNFNTPKSGEKAVVMLNGKVKWIGRGVVLFWAISVAAFYYPHKTSLLSYFRITFAGVIVIVALEAIISLGIKAIEQRKWNNRSKRFELVFGWPLSARREYVQQAVDVELTQRARRLWAVCEQQAQFSQKVPVDMNTILGEIIDLGEVIKELKRIFWDARALAEELRFAVKGSFKDYVEVAK